MKGRKCSRSRAAPSSSGCQHRADPVAAERIRGKRIAGRVGIVVGLVVLPCNHLGDVVSPPRRAPPSRQQGRGGEAVC